MEKIRVFLADWQVLFREGIHFTLPHCQVNSVKVVMSWVRTLVNNIAIGYNCAII